MPDFRTIHELAAGLAEGEYSSRDLTQASLDEIAATDGVLKAWVAVATDRALAEADASDQRRKEGRTLGPLDGIPYGAKDLYDTEGVETRSSSEVLAGRIPDRDCSAVARLRDAGAVLVGKTNTHEFAYGAATPPTSNPWNLKHVPGGSSGGTGAAVASGQVPFGLGTDTGGSIRIPTAFCGLSGIKPTFGRVPKDGVAALSWSTDHTGPMCHDIEDVAISMNILAGHAERDPNSGRFPVPDYMARLRSGVQGAKLGVANNYFKTHFPDVQAAFDTAVGQLAAAGADIVSVDVPESIEMVKPAAFAIWLAEGSAYHQARYRRQKDQYTADVAALILPGEFILGTDYINARRFRSRFNHEMRQMYDQTGIQALLTPTNPGTAFGQDWAEYTAPDGWSDAVLSTAIHFTSPFNMTGQPAATIPSGFDANDLPYGLQIVGRPWADDFCLQVAYAYQQVTDWHLRHPAPVAG